MYVTVEQLKKQCYVDSSDDDTYMEGLIEAAQTAVENDIQQPLSGLESGGKIPAPLMQAILLVAANLYTNREPVAFANPQPVPYTLQYLIKPYIHYT